MEEFLLNEMILGQDHDEKIIRSSETNFQKSGIKKQKQKKRMNSLQKLVEQDRLSKKSAFFESAFEDAFETQDFSSLKAIDKLREESR